jgi:hypothetical protein
MTRVRITRNAILRGAPGSSASFSSSEDAFADVAELGTGGARDDDEEDDAREVETTPRLRSAARRSVSLLKKSGVTHFVSRLLSRAPTRPTTPPRLSATMCGSSSASTGNLSAHAVEAMCAKSAAK